MARVTYLGNIRGPQGYTGPDGRQGLPGVNAVPADEAVAAYAAAPGSQTKTALDSQYGLSPSPVDQRPLTLPSAPSVRLSPRTALGLKPATGSATLDADLVFGERRNVWQYTEDVASSRYVTSSMTKGTDQITVDGITLTRVTSASFGGTMRTQSASFLTGLTVGARYMVSSYMVSLGGIEKFVWTRNGMSNFAAPGHGQRLLSPNRLTRVWRVMQATTTSRLSDVQDPKVGFDASDTGSDLFWLRQAGADGGTLDVYVGGFQIELAPTGAVDGIAGIGDSTMQGSSGSFDDSRAREWLGYTAGLLNVSTYNRAVGGQRTDQMDARWAADITAIKSVCKYVIIQGGINDINQERVAVDIKASLMSMYNKAIADGLIPVLVTITPATLIAATAAREATRVEMNTWIKSTFPNVIDIASVVEDPLDKSRLRRTTAGTTGWAGSDGTHYTQAAKRAIAETVAAWIGWDFPKPSPYQKVVAATFTDFKSSVVLTSPSGNKFRVSVSDTGTITGTAV